MNAQSSVDRITRRFAEAHEPAPLPAPHSSESRPVSDVRRVTPGRFDVVRGRRAEAPANVADQPKPRGAFDGPARPASWVPQRAGGQTVAVEQYRRLGAALIHANRDRATKIIMIASSVSGEGKSLTAANVAVTF